MRTLRRGFRLALGLVLGLSGSQCKPRESAPQSTPAQPAQKDAESPVVVAARAKWRADQDRMMRSELSPLSRVDYVHLDPGDHEIKPATPPWNFTQAALAPYSGSIKLHVEPGKLTFSASAPISLSGKESAGAALRSHDVLIVGRLRLLVSEIGSDSAIAVYDVQAPARVSYSGLHYHPDDPAYVTTAHLERYPAPRTVRVAASRGEDREMQELGVLRFTLAGQRASLLAFSEQPGSNRLFLIFRDATCGKPGESYGAGRYLYATVEKDDSVILDFNQAWNPLCAYSSYFHCPMPPRANWFSFAVPVGEKVYRENP